MPDELARGSLTAMECFRFHVSSHTPFLPYNTQGVVHDFQVQGGGIDTWRQRFQVQCVLIFVEIGQWVTPCCSTREKRRAEKRLITGARLVENSIELTT